MKSPRGALLLLGLLTTSAAAQARPVPDQLQSLSGAFERVATRLGPAVVQVLVTGSHE